MRRLLLAALVLISVPAATKAEFDRARCADLIPQASKLAEHLGDSVRTLAQGDTTFVKDTTGPLNEAGRRAEAARARLLAATRAYQGAMEEVTYQLRLCAE